MEKNFTNSIEIHLYSRRRTRLHLRNVLHKDRARGSLKRVTDLDAVATGWARAHVHADLNKYVECVDLDNDNLSWFSSYLHGVLVRGEIRFNLVVSPIGEALHDFNGKSLFIIFIFFLFRQIFSLMMKTDWALTHN